MGKKKLLDIVKYPEGILNSATNEYVEDFGSKWIYDLAINMIHTMRSVRGVGIAASQISIPIRMAIALADNQPLVLINPEIIEHSDEQASMTEECLSCPNEAVRIDRYVWVKVKYNDLKGKEKTILLDGINSIVAQHEIDHLNGKLIMDYKKEGES